jgi:hypothetical protein
VGAALQKRLRVRRSLQNMIHAMGWAALLTVVLGDRRANPAAGIGDRRGIPGTNDAAQRSFEGTRRTAGWAGAWMERVLNVVT